jgi:hypothetical protein
MNLDVTPKGKWLLQTILANFLEDSSAKASLLLGDNSLVISAGGLSNNAIEDLKTAIQRDWKALIRNNISRLMSLVLDDAYQLVGINLMTPEDYLLCLVFPIKTGLKQIEREMDACIQALRGHQLKQEDDLGELERTLHLSQHRTQDPAAMTTGGANKFAWHREINGEPVATKDQSNRKHLNMPENPETTSPEFPVKRVLSFGASRKSVNDRHPERKSLVQAVEDIPLNPVEWVALTEEEIQMGDSSIVEKHADASTDLVSLFHDDFDLDERLEDQNSIIVPRVTDQVFLEKESDGQDSFDHETNKPVTVGRFTFYFVPRLKGQLITGELPGCLRRWIEELCEIYAWQLISLSVRPEFLQWTLDDFPETLILDMLQIVRAYTSERVYQLFPEFPSDSFTNDFWASEYLVDAYNQKYSLMTLLAQIQLDQP